MTLIALLHAPDLAPQYRTFALRPFPFPNRHRHRRRLLGFRFDR